MNPSKNKLFFNFSEGRVLKLSLFIFSFILLVSFISAVGINNPTLPSITAPEIKTITFNNNSGSVNNSIYWQGHTGTDGTWFTGIPQYTNNICFANGTNAYTYNSSYDTKNTSQWIRSGGDIYYQNLTGKVGIGTTAPSSILTINGTATNSPMVSLIGQWNFTGTATTNKPVVLLEQSGTTSTGWDTGGTALGVNAPSTFNGNLLDLQKNGVSALYVRRDGVVQLSTTGEIRLSSVTLTGVGLRTSAKSVVLALGYAGNDNSAGAEIDVAGVTATNPGTIIFYTGTNSTGKQKETMRLTANGSLGIATSTPTATLDVNGTINVTGDVKPTITSTHSLGSTTLRWLKGWFTNLDVNGSTNITGDLFQTNGNATYNGIYGGIWNKTTGGFITIDLVTTEVYVPIKKLNAGESNAMGSDGQNVTVQIAGMYKASMSASIEKGQVSEYGMKLFINGVAQERCYSHFETLATVGGTPAFNCFVRLVVGDKVYVGIDDHMNPVNDPSLTNMDLNLLRVGN